MQVTCKLRRRLGMLPSASGIIGGWTAWEGQVARSPRAGGWREDKIDGNDLVQLFDQLFDGLVEVDPRGRVMRWNRTAERMTGYAASKVLGKSFLKQPAKHVSPSGRELPETRQPLLQTAKDGIPRDALAYITHAEGYRLTLITRCFPVFDGREHPVGAIELFNDNKALIAAFHVAETTDETIVFDPLTGIGNRSHIESKIRSALDGFKSRQVPFGILFIDIDHFKLFNDTRGHLAGDKLLRLVANTIRNNLRMSDSCGRWGGEEFIALVYGLDLRGLGKVAEKLRLTIQESRMPENGVEMGVTVSIGATLVRSPDNLHSVIDRADRLMYRSKRDGRNRVSLA